jgi:hypothetical protein
MEKLVSFNLIASPKIANEEQRQLGTKYIDTIYAVEATSFVQIHPFHFQSSFETTSTQLKKTLVSKDQVVAYPLPKHMHQCTRTYEVQG